MVAPGPGLTVLPVRLILPSCLPYQCTWTLNVFSLSRLSILFIYHHEWKTRIFSKHKPNIIEFLVKVACILGVGGLFPFFERKICEGLEIGKVSFHQNKIVFLIDDRIKVSIWKLNWEWNTSHVFEKYSTSVYLRACPKFGKLPHIIGEQSEAESSDLSSYQNGTQPNVPAFSPLPGTVMPNLSVHLQKDGWLHEARKETEVLRQTPGRSGEVLGVLGLWTRQWWGWGLSGLMERGGYHLAPTLLYKWGSAGPEKEMTCLRPRGTRPQGEGPAPPLPSPPAFLHGTTVVFQLWYPCLFVKSRMVLIPYKFEWGCRYFKMSYYGYFSPTGRFPFSAPCQLSAESCLGLVTGLHSQCPTQGDSVSYSNSGICPPGNSPHIDFHIAWCHSIRSSHFPSGPRTCWQEEASTRKRSTSEWAWDVKRGPVPAFLLLNILMPFVLTAISMEYDFKIWLPEFPLRCWVMKRKEKDMSLFVTKSESFSKAEVPNIYWKQEVRNYQWMSGRRIPRFSWFSVNQFVRKCICFHTPNSNLMPPVLFW